MIFFFFATFSTTKNFHRFVSDIILHFLSYGAFVHDALIKSLVVGCVLVVQKNGYHATTASTASEGVGGTEEH